MGIQLSKVDDFLFVLEQWGLQLDAINTIVFYERKNLIGALLPALSLDVKLVQRVGVIMLDCSLQLAAPIAFVICQYLAFIYIAVELFQFTFDDIFRSEFHAYYWSRYTGNFFKTCYMGYVYLASSV
ncbi:hypothetical protein ACJMK2_043323 [Sinanodonta woodiana]|uniref:Uncharacterized protein n=1 Tax=Sinanodonta woodiana TaxID=1069815 RepID=A0ABD3VX17_SINWO